jgi:hypothetical protein
VRRPHKFLSLFVAALIAVAVPFAGLGVAGAGIDVRRDPGPFEGLGAWVDAFDYAPAFQANGAPPSVTAESVNDMAALGVKTLYLQAAMNDSRAPEMIIDSALVGDFLRRAHRRGMEVVAWYYPTLEDADTDVAHVRALADFRFRGERFDALALDIESIQTVKSVDERNDRVVDVARRARKIVGDSAPLGSIVYPAVQAEVINPALWPKFPYKRLAKSLDVWMPMAYWTFRDGTYRDPYNYTEESIRRLRANLGDKKAFVHPVGGIGNSTNTADYESFLRAVYETKSVGWSVYDYNTVASSAWPRMRTGGVPTTTTTARTSPPVTTTALP